MSDQQVEDLYKRLVNEIAIDMCDVETEVHLAAVTGLYRQLLILMSLQEGFADVEEARQGVLTAMTTLEVSIMENFEKDWVEAKNIMRPESNATG